MAARTLETTIAGNVARVREEIAVACACANRNPDGVTLIGVTKGVTRPVVDALLAAGVRDLGESRVQDALIKFGLRGSDNVPLPPDVRLHMIGNLQTNKVRDAVRAFTAVHSLNRPALANDLDRAVTSVHKPFAALIEVNLSGETTKQGATVAEAWALAKHILVHCPALPLEGLMTIAPHTDDSDALRAAFRRLRELRDELRDAMPALSLPALSMGMSNDYPTAIAEGATHIRVGRALFVGIEDQ